LETGKINQCFFKDLHQVGIISRNLKETIKKYSDLYHIYPWNVWEYGPSIVEDMEIYSKRKNHKMRIATCKSRNIDFEIIEPLDNISIYSAFLDRYGEGLHHLNFEIFDYDHIINSFCNKGIGVAQYGNLSGKHKYAYLDTFHELDYYIEISKNFPGYKKIPPLYTYPAKTSNKTDKAGQIFSNIGYIGIFSKDLPGVVLKMKKNYCFEDWHFFKISQKGQHDFFAKEEDNLASDVDVAICNMNNVRLVIIKAEEIGSMKITRKGLHHLGFPVNDIDQALAYCKTLNLKIECTGTFHNSKFAYLSTDVDLKFPICVYEANQWL
jgi:methylmalonyl-CoA/ethylmalonyl-CoA epimerase